MFGLVTPHPLVPWRYSMALTLQHWQQVHCTLAQDHGLLLLLLLLLLGQHLNHRAWGHTVHNHHQHHSLTNHYREKLNNFAYHSDRQVHKAELRHFTIITVDTSLTIRFMGDFLTLYQCEQKCIRNHAVFFRRSVGENYKYF